MNIRPIARRWFRCANIRCDRDSELGPFVFVEFLPPDREPIQIAVCTTCADEMKAAESDPPVPLDRAQLELLPPDVTAEHPVDDSWLDVTDPLFL